jgi:DnaJ-class molecular chaperone
MSERLIKCFLCKGTGKSPDLPDTKCTCCGGKGKITHKLYLAKKRLAKDITIALLKLGV